jgi:tetratricopeptide (TPR) repeat protein
MSHKRIVVAIICVLLVAIIVVLGLSIWAMKPGWAAVCSAIGLGLSGVGKYDQAIAFYTKAIELNPEDSSFYALRGDSYEYKNEYDQAIADYNKAIEMDPGHWWAYETRGNIYKSKGEYDQAIADYTKAIELKPDITPLYLERGLAYKSKGEYEKAASDFETIIQTSDSAGFVLDAREALKSIGK